jgi:hypothetical protein
MPGVGREVMCKAWTSVPNVLCEVQSSVCVLPEVCSTWRGVHFCVMLCARYGVLSYVLREVWGSVSCPAPGMALCVKIFCARYGVLCQMLCLKYEVLTAVDIKVF